jgi:hypothetical protein
MCRGAHRAAEDAKRKAAIRLRVPGAHADEPTPATVCGGRLYVVRARVDSGGCEPAGVEAIVSCPW